MKNLRAMAREASALVRRSARGGRGSQLDRRPNAPEGLGLPPPSGDLSEWATSVVSSVRDAPPAAVLSDVDLLLLRQAANEAFTAGNLRDADFAYAYVTERGANDYFLRLRRADLAAQLGNLSGALRQLEDLIRDPDYDYRVDFVKATTLLAAGRPHEAATCLRGVLHQFPERLDYARMLFTALERAGDMTALTHPEEFVRALPPAGQFELVLRARCFCGQLDEASKMIGDDPERASQLPSEALAAVITPLVDRGAFNAAAQLAELTGALESDSPKVAAAVLNLLCAQGRWQEAERLVERCQEMLWRTRPQGLWRSIVRYYCLTSRLGEARDLVARWNVPADAPDAAATTLAVLLSTIGEWDQLISYMAERVDAGLPISDRHILDALRRATRQTRRYAEVGALLTNSLSSIPIMAVEQCREGLLVEEGVFGEIGLLPKSTVPPSVPGALRRRVVAVVDWGGCVGPTTPYRESACARCRSPCERQG